MNLNSINYESVNDLYDPGYFSGHEAVYENNDNGYDENMHKLMLLHVYSLLDMYDNNLTLQPLPNPYQDKLIFETKQGTVEIPIEIQKAAIVQWNALKEKRKLNNVSTDNQVNMIDSLFQFLLCILIIFTLMYTLSLFRKGVIRF